MKITSAPLIPLAVVVGSSSVVSAVTGADIGAAEAEAMPASKTPADTIPEITAIGVRMKTSQWCRSIASLRLF